MWQELQLRGVRLGTFAQAGHRSTKEKNCQRVGTVTYPFLLLTLNNVQACHSKSHRSNNCRAAYKFTGKAADVKVKREAVEAYLVGAREDVVGSVAFAREVRRCLLKRIQLEGPTACYPMQVRVTAVHPCNVPS